MPLLVLSQQFGDHINVSNDPDIFDTLPAIAVDKNKTAIDLANRNITINKIKTTIDLYHEDAKNMPDIIKKRNLFPDRIIMNLSFHAHLFFVNALQCIDEKTVIHFYTIGSYESINLLLNELEMTAESKGFSIFIENKRIIKSYSPHEFYMGIDITAKKI